MSISVCVHQKNDRDHRSVYRMDKHLYHERGPSERMEKGFGANEMG